MTDLSEKRIRELKGILESKAERAYDSQEEQIYLDLLAVLSDYARVKAENEKLRDKLHDITAALAKTETEATHNYAKMMKAEAELAEQVPPEKEPEPKQYRCAGCGRFFDENTSSHARSEDDGHGNEMPVECGPITEFSAPPPAIPPGPRGDEWRKTLKYWIRDVWDHYDEDPNIGDKESYAVSKQMRRAVLAILDAAPSSPSQAGQPTQEVEEAINKLDDAVDDAYAYRQGRTTQKGYTDAEAKKDCESDRAALAVVKVALQRYRELGIEVGEKP